MAYPSMPGYPAYQQSFNPYQDRLAQLQSQYQQTMPQMQPTQQNINQGLLWVQGESGAKSYLVAPNTTVLLMDSEGSRFYLKSTDGSGMPSLRTFEYMEVPQNAPQAHQGAQNNLDDKYVTREEYNGLQAQYQEIMDKLNSFQAPVLDKSDRIEAKGSTGRNKGGNNNE